MKQKVVTFKGKGIQTGAVITRIIYFGQMYKTFKTVRRKK